MKISPERKARLSAIPGTYRSTVPSRPRGGAALLQAGASQPEAAVPLSVAALLEPPRAMQAIIVNNITN